MRIASKLRSNKAIGFYATSLLIILALLQVGPAFAQGRPRAKVVVSESVNHEIRDKITLIGTVEPWRSSTVAAELAGKVEDLLVRRGALLKKGEVIARLGKRELLFEMKISMSRKNAIAARLENAREDFERSERLIQSQGIPEREYKDAGLEVRELEENLAEAETQILRIQDALEKKTVRAPFNGTVTEELTEIGEWVQEGGAIVHIVDLSRVRVLVDIPEKYVSGVIKKEEVKVLLDAFEGRSFEGRIHTLIPAGDPDAHVFPLEIHVKNEDGLIKAGMLARAEFHLGLKRAAIMVQKDAIITRGARSYLFTVHEGKAKQVFITTARSEGNLVEVKGSLEAGQQVIIRGNERVRDGQPVQVILLTDSKHASD